MYVSKLSSFVSPLRYSLILAVDQRGGMGLNNDLPWKLAGVENKTDMQWFREKTKGKIILMGYNTWVSIGRKPLPGRYNVIISKAHRQEVNDDMKKWGDEYYKTEKGQKEPIHSMVCESIPAALAALQAGVGNFHRGGEVMVIGGARIYEAMMEHTSRIYLTTFAGEFEADTFVTLNLNKWDLRYRDTMQYLEPKFEIWDTTEDTLDIPDSEIIQISYGHKPAAGWLADSSDPLKQPKVGE